MDATQPEKTSSPPPPPAPPPAPKPSVAEQAKADIAAMKTGPDPLRPVRYALSFVGGTLNATVDGVARLGRKGMWVGLGLGILSGIAGSNLLVLAFAGAVGGFGVGVLAGAAKGLATGGYKAVGRLYRGERYAEDLVERSKVQHKSGANDINGHAAQRRRQRIDGVNTTQILERQNEIERDYNTYWRDHVAQSTSNGKGIGY